MEQLPGLVYELHYPGGPEHGPMAFAFSPYFRMKHPDKGFYQAEMDGEQPVMKWGNDEMPVITLYFEGYWRRRNRNDNSTVGRADRNTPFAGGIDGQVLIR